MSNREVVKISVTQEDINLGAPRKALWCPIARAVVRAVCREGELAQWIFSTGQILKVKGDLDEEVETGHIRLSEKDSNRGAEIERFVQDFDNGWRVNPIEFEVEVVRNT